MSRSVIELKNLIDKCADDPRLPDYWWDFIFGGIVAEVDPQDDREDDILFDLIRESGMGIILTPQWDDDAIRRLSDIYDSTPVLEVPTETASANTAIP